jgi:hypothetical protein
MQTIDRNELTLRNRWSNDRHGFTVQERGDFGLMGVPHYPLDPRQLGQLFRHPLGVAARHQQPDVWIFSPGAADRTGIYHCNVGLTQAGYRRVPPLAKLLLYGGSVSLRGPAPEILDIETHTERSVMC